MPILVFALVAALHAALAMAAKLPESVELETAPARRSDDGSLLLLIVVVILLIIIWMARYGLGQHLEDMGGNIMRERSLPDGVDASEPELVQHDQPTGHSQSCSLQSTFKTTPECESVFASSPMAAQIINELKASHSLDNLLRFAQGSRTVGDFYEKISTDPRLAEVVAGIAISIGPLTPQLQQCISSICSSS